MPVSNRELSIVNMLLMAAALALVFGIFAPMLTLQKLVFITNTFSLYSGVVALFREGQWALCLIIFGFSIVLPGMKIAVLFSIWNRSGIFSDSETKLFHWLSLLNKWSMLDVFVVAVLLASVKLGALASVEVHAGLYAFAVAVVLIMLVTHRVKRVLKTVP
jgi:paraquat-inducible protein A